MLEGALDVGEVMLRTSGLVKEYAGRRGKPPVRALRGVSLELQTGRTLGVVEAPIEEAFLRDDIQARLAKVAAQQSAVHMRARRERNAASAATIHRRVAEAWRACLRRCRPR